mmetsp:Transcript_14306/g.43988  ORF Transcript_14306/g.43988 Transcript_14306/m.43988 type:complete len:106 (-) Transcript_14306:62-379(-)
MLKKPSVEQKEGRRNLRHCSRTRSKWGHKNFCFSLWRIDVARHEKPSRIHHHCGRIWYEKHIQLQTNYFTFDCSALEYQNGWHASIADQITTDTSPCRPFAAFAY